MSTATLTLTHLPSASTATSVGTVHLYRRFGHVLCRHGAVADLSVTKDSAYVTCPDCLSMRQALRTGLQD